MTKLHLPWGARFGATMLMAIVGLGLILGAATFAGPASVSKVLAQATTTTSATSALTTVTTSGTTTTVTTTAATTVIATSGAATQISTPPPATPRPAQPATPPPAQPAGLPPNGTGGLLNQQSGSSFGTLWLPLLALVLAAGGAGGYVFLRRR